MITREVVEVIHKYPSHCVVYSVACKPQGLEIFGGQLFRDFLMDFPRKIREIRHCWDGGEGTRPPSTARELCRGLEEEYRGEQGQSRISRQTLEGLDDDGGDDDDDRIQDDEIRE